MKEKPKTGRGILSTLGNVYDSQMSGIKIQKYLTAQGSKQIKLCSLHQFLNASEEGYGQLTYR